MASGGSRNRRVQREAAVEKLKSEFIDQMEVKLDAVINDLVMMSSSSLVDDQKQEPRFIPSVKEDDNMKRKSGGGGGGGGFNRNTNKQSTKLPEKVFVSRPSPLTELLQITHFRTIHHIFIATLILIMLHTVILDLVEQNTVDLGLERLMWAFGNPQMTLAMLVGLEFCGLVVLYPSFHFWSKFRRRVRPELTTMIDMMAIGCFLLFLTGMMCVPAGILWGNPLPPASGATVTMEQCRLLMKMYAFVRSNAPRVLLGGRRSKQREGSAEEHHHHHNNRDKFLSESDKLVSSTSKDDDDDDQEVDDVGDCAIRRRRGRSVNERVDKSSVGGFVKDDDDDESKMMPSYSKYLYFYVSPTLIYKDKYPRTTHIRWDYVCWNFAHVLGCIVYANFILSRYSTFYFINFGHPDHPMTVLQFCNAVFSMMLPGILGLVLGFYLLLHSWHNAFAEMLCFGDRLFYKDWWNCSSFHSYYKTWNILVHDWLYTYIFKDAWELGLATHNKSIPTILVFVISSLFHEYVLSFTFNFFFPVLLTLFGGFGLALTFVRNSDGSAVGNIFMWFGLIARSGILVSTYTMEFYARINCPPVVEEVVDGGDMDAAIDFFTPRFWTCNAIVWG